MAIKHSCDELWGKFAVWAEHYAGSLDEESKKKFLGQYRDLTLSITKSCLLDRMIYGGEQPSQTKCPVHLGKWSGIHLGWPNTFWSNGKPIEESPMLRGWYEAGCRCYMHSCDCTTGWLVDNREDPPAIQV